MPKQSKLILSPAQRDAALRPLPSMQIVDGPDWLTVDAAYVDQLAEKARLIARHRPQVLTSMPEAREASAEVLDEVVRLLGTRSDFEVTPCHVRRPDHVTIRLDRAKPLLTLSQLIQEDVCILQKKGDVHRLTAALLCFPASWTLSEKFGRALTDIHAPVPEYDSSTATRVQRLFDGVSVDHAMWRANLLRYEDPQLYQPKSESEPRKAQSKTARFERSERQTIWRLPKSRAVVFAIHTTIVPVVKTA